MNTDVLAICFILALVTLYTLFMRRVCRVCPHCHAGWYLDPLGLKQRCPYCNGGKHEN